jgi:SAM-dependent methyltransferase
MWLLIIAVLVFCFSFVLFFGAPYLPTLKPQIATFFELPEIKDNQTILELGCGDGRVLIAAARANINAVGIELNPLLALLAWVRTIRYRRRVKVIWPEVDVIFTFLLPKYMEKLDKKCIQYKYKPVKLVSFAFEIKKKKQTKKTNGLYLYQYE